MKFRSRAEICSHLVTYKLYNKCLLVLMARIKEFIFGYALGTDVSIILQFEKVKDSALQKKKQNINLPVCSGGPGFHHMIFISMDSSA